MSARESARPGDTARTITVPDDSIGPMWGPDDVAFVVGTYREDVHYCRPLLASLRHFYPDHEIIVIVDGKLRRDELPSWPGVRVLHSEDLARQAGLPLTGYLAKLNLFRWDEFDRYAYFDADSLLLTPLFDHELFAESADFYALGGSRVDLTDPRTRDGFIRSALAVDRVQRDLDPGFDPARMFSVICGHFVVRPNAQLTELLDANLEHTSRHWEPGPIFHLNDQSLLIYALNKLEDAGVLSVRLGSHLLIPRDGQDVVNPHITAEAVARGAVADPHVLHWTRPCRVPELGDHEFGDVLTHFERAYYQASPNPSLVAHRRRRRRRDLTRRLGKGIRYRAERMIPALR